MRGIPAVTVLQWVNRYGSLCEHLDNTNGYGTFHLILHGRRAVKVGRVGKMISLPPVDYKILANTTAA